MKCDLLITSGSRIQATVDIFPIEINTFSKFTCELLGISDIGAYAALQTIVRTSDESCIPAILSLLISLVEQVNADSDELVISGKCGIISACAARLEEIDTLAASILTCATRLLQQNCAAEEALMVVSTVSQRCPAACAAVASSLCPLIHGYVTDVSRETIFITALGVFGDICRCVGEQGQHHVEQFMTSVLGYLRNPDLPSKLTISVIEAMADASLYLGSGFRTYTAASMQALVAKASEAATLPLEEQVTIQQSLCEAFTCVVQHIHHHGYAGDLISTGMPKKRLVFINRFLEESSQQLCASKTLQVLKSR